MSKQHEKLVAKLFQNVWNEGKLTVLKEILSTEFTVHFTIGTMQGLKAFENVITAWRTAFPDIHHDVDEIISTSDKVIVRWHGSGTHKGIFMGLVPTGHKMSYSGITIFNVKNDKFTDAWVHADMLNIMKDLKVFSDKVYTETDFDVDFNGPAGQIYRWVMQARSTPACKQKLVNALRESFSTVPIDNKPALNIPDELFSQVSVEEIHITRKNGKVRALVYHPKSKTGDPLPVIIYIHGGGWSLSKPEEADLLTRKLALTSQIVVISVDYRLAPENPYPAGLDDCVAAYEWARANAKQKLKANPEHVAIGGDSSGGNLALSVCLRIKDEGKKMPDAVLALCPLTDFVFEKFPSTLKFGPNGLIYDLAFVSLVRSVYSPYTKWQHPYVSPMYGNLKNFPPTFMLIAGQDLLLDDNKQFAEKLKEAGNDVEVLIHEEMPHAYYYFLGLSKEEELAYQAFNKFLQRVLKK